MKLAILQNSDVIEKNGCQIRTQRPKISKGLLVPSNAQIFVALCNLCIADFKFDRNNRNLLPQVVRFSNLRSDIFRTAKYCKSQRK